MPQDAGRGPPSGVRVALPAGAVATGPLVQGQQATSLRPLPEMATSLALLPPEEPNHPSSRTCPRHSPGPASARLAVDPELRGRPCRPSLCQCSPSPSLDASH